MVKKDDILDENNSVHSEDTTESSDSYSYLLRDVENRSNHINEEWEAIERTLYQENGKHVTDPVLLKECKLWRETFPHFRVRGTAIRVEQEEKVGAQSNKGVQSIDKNHLPLSKLNERREKIKKTVVSHIVERLTNKLNLNNENSLISEKLINGKGDTKPKVNDKSSGTESEVESYYERGKKKENKRDMTQTTIDEFAESAKHGIYHKNEVSSTLNDFESNISTDCFKIGNRSGLWSGYDKKKSNRLGREFSSNLAKNEEILRSGNITFKINEKNSSIQRKREITSDSSPSGVFKPFEITKKIDKKYESMLERILGNKGFIGSDSKKLSKPEVISYRESEENVTGKSTRDNVAFGRNKQLPKLNNFTNNWMNRGDLHSYDPYGTFFTGNPTDTMRSYRNIGKQSNFQSCRSANNSYQFDEKFFEEIGREICDYTTNSVKRDFEEINLRRPQFRSRYNESKTTRTQKSSSCSELPKKKIPKCNSKAVKSSLEKGKSELSVRNGNKNGSQNVQLPPIETSIICTEIIGRPKAASRPLPKKYI